VSDLYEKEWLKGQSSGDVAWTWSASSATL